MRLGGLRLYLDDVEDVRQLLAERSQTVTLHAGEAVADTADDLKSATDGELADIRITARSPEAEVRLGRDAEARVGSGTDWALLLEIQRMLQAHHMPRLQRTVLEVFAALPFLPGAVLIYVAGDKLHGWSANILGLAAMAVTILGLRVTGIPLDRAKRAAVVLPYRRNEMRSLSIQTRTGMSASLVSGALLAVLGIPLALLLAWLTDFFGLKT
jgi:hypothetical protein